MNPALMLMSAALFLWGMGESLFLYFQPIYLSELGANPVKIGAILGAAGLAMTLSHIPAGYLADKINRRILLRAAWVSGLSSALLMASARTLSLFTVGIVLYSLTVFVVSPLNSYITAASGKWSVTRTLTLISATYNLGAVLGPIAGGILGDKIGLRSVYFVSAGIFALSNVFVFLLPSQPVTKHESERAHLDILKNSRYLGFLALSFFVMFSMYLPQPLTPNFLHDVRLLSLSQIGKMGAAAGLGNAFFNLTLGALDARVGFMLGQMSAWFFSLLIWKGESLPLFALGYFLLGGYRASRPLVTAQVRGLVRHDQMGIAYGITETVNSLPIILAPPLAGYLYTKDAASIYPLALSLILLGVALTFVFAPRQQPLLQEEEMS